nr:MAG TPA: hypothetical protein [Caudoviricetes sp.]
MNCWKFRKDNQQRNLIFFIRDVQRLSRKRVGPSGSKRKISFI